MSTPVHQKRFLCIYLPMWSIERCKKRLRSTTTTHTAPAKSSYEVVAEDCGAAEKEPLLISKENGKRIVRRAGVRAQAAGVREGTPLALAEVLFPDATVMEFDPLGDYRTLFTLALWALRFSPSVALDPELTAHLKRKEQSTPSRLHNGIVLDLYGTGRLHKSESLLISRIDQALQKSGYHARFAISRTIGSAWALARFSRQRISLIPAEENLLPVLLTLPLEALRIPQTLADALRDMGLSSIGDVIKLPRRALANRFGFKIIERLDQLNGALNEPLRYVSTEKKYAVSARFQTPLWNIQAVQKTVKNLFVTLQQNLAKDHQAACRFVVSLKSALVTDVPAYIRKELSLNSALGDTSKAHQIIDPFISTIRCETGIEQCTITAFAPHAAHALQHTFPSFEDEHCAVSRAEFEHLLNQYAARFGNGKILRATFEESHLPEHSSSYHPLNTKETFIRAHRTDAPSHILKNPEEVTVIALLPDYAPAVINWRRKRLKIIRSVGPEKITAPWWGDALQTQTSSRAYFKIQEERGWWLWLFREEASMRWFVHGIWA